MCGRFANSETIPAQAARFAAGVAAGTEDWQPTWNAAPGQRHPVVIQDRSSRRLGLMRWGWKPGFLAGRMLVNARGEEALGKPTFAEAMARRRCLVPATAFYEWQERSDGPSLPHAIAMAGRGPFAIAGLWEPASADDGQRIGLFILLTVPANPVVAPVHHRMAAIIRPEEEGRWLDPGTGGRDASGLLQPYPAEAMAAWPVPLAVNRVTQDGPQLLGGDGPAPR